MRKKKTIKLKLPSKIIIGILVAIIVIFIVYQKNISDLVKIGYSREAAASILSKFEKSYCMKKKDNKTLNAAFESKHYNEKNLDNYSKIVYQEHENLIKNINTLVNKKYSNHEISMILSRGDDKEVTEFAKRDKVRYLDEFYELEYAKIKNYDRYIKYMDEEGEDAETTVLYVNLENDKENYKDPLVIDKYDKYVLVNKRRKLTKEYKPKKLVKVDSKYAIDGEQYAEKEAVDAFITMSDAAKKEGYSIRVNSSYRSYEDQEEIVKTYRGLYGDTYVSNYVALPGFSEHQTGFAFDVGSTSGGVFRDTKEFAWMLENAYKYGFIYRYPILKEKLTGFANEAWHYRYVGTKIAKYMYENNLCYEEYYIRFLDK